MKRQFTMGFLVLSLCLSGMAFSQQATSKNARGLTASLFSGIATKTPVNRIELERITHFIKSEQVSIKLADNLTFSGEVIEKTDAPGVQSWNIRLSNFANALLNISLINQPDRTQKIIGRVIHRGLSEALVIEEEGGKYYVTKHKMEFFMVE